MRVQQSLVSQQNSPFGGSDLEFVWSLFHICEFPSTTFEFGNGLCKGWPDFIRLLQLLETASKKVKARLGAVGYFETLEILSILQILKTQNM
jgi:hypothetical protein